MRVLVARQPWRRRLLPERHRRRSRHSGALALVGRVEMSLLTDALSPGPQEASS